MLTPFYMILERLEYFPGVMCSICDKDGALIVVTDPNEIYGSHLFWVRLF